MACRGIFGSYWDIYAQTIEEVVTIDVSSSL